MKMLTNFRWAIKRHKLVPYTISQIFSSAKRQDALANGLRGLFNERGILTPANWSGVDLTKLEEVVIEEVYGKLFNKKVNGLLLDVGSQYGDYGVLLLKRKMVDFVVQFEPLDTNIVKAKELAEVNGVADKMEFHNIAASNINGTLQLQSDGSMASVTNQGMHKHSVICEARTIDSFNFTGVGLVKVDTEGSELNVLQGMNRLLAIEHPNIIIETHSESLNDMCRQFLEIRGYRFHKSDALRRTKDGQQLQNLVYV